MRAQDINLKELLDFQPETGRLLMNGQRMLLFSQSALGALDQLLVRHLGHSFAAAVFSQFGYQCGYDDYQVIGGAGNWDSDEERITSGPVVHMWEGIVHVEPTLLRFDRATGDFLMTGIWRNSFEAQNHLANYGVATAPVCATLTGYASGWSSAFFAGELLAIETACLGQGDDHCAFEIRPMAAWDTRAEPWRRALQADLHSVSSALERRVAQRTSELHEANRLQRELEHRLRHDPLTGVLSRTELDRVLVALHNDLRSPGTLFAILFCDVDSFKQINDTRGHAAGDDTLATVAERIRGAVRVDDVVARRGGDEFVVVLNSVHSADQALAVAEAIRRAVQAPITTGSREHPIMPTLSIGVTVAPRGSDPTAALERADAALLRAKEEGRNRVSGG